MLLKSARKEESGNRALIRWTVFYLPVKFWYIDNDVSFCFVDFNREIQYQRASQVQSEQLLVTNILWSLWLNAVRSLPTRTQVPRFLINHSLFNITESFLQDFA